MGRIILFTGKGGTGKTMLLRAFARSIGVKYTYPDANDWLNG